MQENQDNRPDYIKRAENDFSMWYEAVRKRDHHFNGKILRASNVCDALEWIIGSGVHGNHSFSYAGTQAWLSGVLPSQFETLAFDWLERAEEGKRRWRKAAAEKGLAYANTRPVDKTLWSKKGEQDVVF